MSKTKKVDFFFDNETGGTDVVTKVIRPIKFKQFTRMIELLIQIFNVAKVNPEIKDLITDLFKGQDDLKLSVAELETLSDEEVEKLQLDHEAKRKQKEAEFTPKVFAAFEILLINLPTLTLDLIATIANVDLEELYEQEIEEVGFEVVNAILYVNDIEKLVERGKQSLGIGKNAFSFMTKAEPPKSSNVLQ